MSEARCSGGRRGDREVSMRGGRILDTAQIRRLIAFSSAADVTIQHFNESRQRSEMFRHDPIFSRPPRQFAGLGPSERPPA